MKFTIYVAFVIKTVIPTHRNSLIFKTVRALRLEGVPKGY